MRDRPPALLVNVAGVGVARATADTSPEEWDLVVGVSLTAVYRMCRVVLPAMIAAGGGVIVNVASVGGMIGLANRAAYCASKAGVIGLAKRSPSTTRGRASGRRRCARERSTPSGSA